MTQEVAASSVGIAGCEQMDAAYSAMLAASDGNIYTALCTHNGRDDAVLVRYEPASRTTHILADMGAATGEKGRATIPQGKVHTRMGEGADGRIYFATHPTYPAGPVPAGSPAGHFMAYDPRSGACRSVAEAPGPEAVITAALDPDRLVMVGLSNPSGKLLICDLKSGAVRDLGPQTNGASPCRTIGIDREGNAWFTREPGEIVRYGAETSAIDKMKARIPALSFPNEAGMGVWRTVVFDPTGGIFYGIHARTSLLFAYDPRIDQAMAIGSVAAEADRGEPLSTFASLAFARAPDGRLYYVAARGIFDFFNSKPLQGAAHLISFEPRTRAITDHGPIVAEGRRLFGSQNAVVSQDGRRLYILGAFEAGPQDRIVPATMLPVVQGDGSRKLPYQLRIGIIELGRLAA